MKIVIGLALIFVVVALGFIRVDETTWLAWRAIWLAGGGGTIGIGISLVIIGAVIDPWMALTPSQDRWPDHIRLRQGKPFDC